MLNKGRQINHLSIFHMLVSENYSCDFCIRLFWRKRAVESEQGPVEATMTDTVSHSLSLSPKHTHTHTQSKWLFTALCRKRCELSLQRWRRTCENNVNRNPQQHVGDRRFVADATRVTQWGRFNTTSWQSSITSTIFLTRLYFITRQHPKLAHIFRLTEALRLKQTANPE